MRVGYLNQPWDCGIPPNPGESIGIWTWQVARCLVRSSCEVLVCARRDAREAAARTWEGVRYARFPLIPSKPQRLLSAAERRFYRLPNPRRPGFASSARYLAYAIWGARTFRSNVCDVVHIHNFSQFVPLARRLNPQARIVLHMHCDWLAQLDRTMIDRRLRHADAILACSEYVAANIRARFPHHADRCTTVFEGTDLKEFHADGRERNASGEERIVFVGRISPEKGLHVLLEAFERVVARRPTARLEIIGPESVAPMEFIVALSDDSAVQGLSRFYSGNYAGFLRQRVRSSLDKHVRFVGTVPHYEVAERLRRADVCVVPSVWNEPFGMPAIEAMAVGLPVVASRAGGLTEIVSDGETGILVEPDNPSALAEALVRLLEDRPRARAMGGAGRQRVEETFSWESITEKLKALYAALCYGARACDGYGSDR